MILGGDLNTYLAPGDQYGTSNGKSTYVTRRKNKMNEYRLIDTGMLQPLTISNIHGENQPLKEFNNQNFNNTRKHDIHMIYQRT